MDLLGVSGISPPWNPSDHFQMEMEMDFLAVNKVEKQDKTQGSCPDLTSSKILGAAQNTWSSSLPPGRDSMKLLEFCLGYYLERYRIPGFALGGFEHPPSSSFSLEVVPMLEKRRQEKWIKGGKDGKCQPGIWTPRNQFPASMKRGEMP